MHWQALAVFTVAVRRSSLANCLTAVLRSRKLAGLLLVSRMTFRNPSNMLERQI